ncbi:MAG: hypothetical protein ACOC3V_00300 [bacterium]
MSVDKIYEMGDDALQNLFDISIDQLSYINDIGSTILRVQNLTIPGSGANTYEVHHKGSMITKPGGKVDAPKEFSFDFRVDRNWLVYKGLVLWKNAIANSITGIVSNDELGDNNRINLTAWAVQPDGDAIPNFGKWLFKGAWISNIGDVGFDYTTGDPIVVTATFNCLGIDDLDL